MILATENNLILRKNIKQMIKLCKKSSHFDLNNLVDTLNIFKDDNPKMIFLLVIMCGFNKFSDDDKIKTMKLIMESMQCINDLESKKEIYIHILIDVIKNLKENKFEIMKNIINSSKEFTNSSKKTIYFEVLENNKYLEEEEMYIIKNKILNELDQLCVNNAFNAKSNNNLNNNNYINKLKLEYTDILQRKSELSNLDSEIQKNQMDLFTNLDLNKRIEAVCSNFTESFSNTKSIFHN